jgi:hypothetical protein
VGGGWWVVGGEAIQFFRGVLHSNRTLTRSGCQVAGLGSGELTLQPGPISPGSYQ